MMAKIFTKEIIETLMKLILIHILTNFFNRGDCDNLSLSEKFELLQMFISKALNKNAPFRKKTKKEQNMGYKPWFKKEFQKRIAERNHLYFLIQNKNKNDLTPKYERLKSSIKKDMKKAEKEYYNEIYEKHKNDSKETW